MRIISSILLCILFTTALGQSESSSTDPTQSTTAASTTEVTTTSEKTSPTVEPTTTTVKTSSVVTTTTISTTTPSPSTQSSTTNVPTSTSSPVPSTKAPEPEPDKCDFNVTEGNVTCIRAEMKAKFIINAEGTLHTIIPGCNTTTVSGDCTSSNDTQTLIVSESTYTLTMLFEKKAGKVLVYNITFSYALPGLPRGFGSNKTDDLFDVKAGNSYRCKSTLDIHLDNITMEVHDVRVQAFIEKNEDFGTVEECDADEKVSDIVPIAVGVALALLIIIVLIAYLVGRRRSRQKGYQSV